jgi:general secretion pathway protein D
VIAEVTLRDNKTSGIQSLGLNVVNGKLVGFNASLPGMRIGGSVDAEGNPTGFATRDGYDLTGIITLGTTPRKNDANILSVPAIVTTHNKEARIFVGQETPVISSYLPDTTTGGGIGTGFGGYRTTVSGREVGIELIVKPLIGADGSVQLEIKQKVEDIIDNVEIDGNRQPIIGKRETESFVSVQNGEIIVLGGLQRDSSSYQRNRLGPIPIIGDLFGSRTRSKDKTDLIFFLRPVVLTNTPLDNAEALRRIQGAPQRQAVERALNPDAPRELETAPDDGSRPRLGPRR